MSALRGDRGWRNHHAGAPPATPRADPGRPLTHLERDALGQHASRLREQQRKAWRRAQWTWHKQRRHDLDAVIAHRYGFEGASLPGGSEMLAVARVMAFHLKAHFGEDGLRESLEAWFEAVWPCSVRAPDDEPDLDEVAAEVRGRRLDLSAIRCGAILNLTWTERCRLGIRTIRNADMTSAEFRAAAAERKRESDRARSSDRRRRHGQAPREEYRWQGDREPWLYLGVSRSTWDRRKKAGRLGTLVEACTIAVPDWLSGFCRDHDAAVAAEPMQPRPSRDESPSQIGEASPAADALSSAAEASPVVQVSEAREQAVGEGQTASVAASEISVLVGLVASMKGGQQDRQGARHALVPSGGDGHGAEAWAA